MYVLFVVMMKLIPSVAAYIQKLDEESVYIFAILTVYFLCISFNYVFLSYFLLLQALPYFKT